MWRSDDDGGSWRPTGDGLTNINVNSMAIDPRRTDVMYVGTGEGYFREEIRGTGLPLRGGGATWQRLLAVNVRGGCLDLAIRPDRDEDVLFASCGSYEQATVYRFPRAADTTMVESVFEIEHQGRTSLAIAPSNPNVIYAMAASNDGGPGGNYRQGLLGVYRSTNGGAAGSWQARVTNSDASKLSTLLLTNPYGATINDCNPAGRNDFTNMGWYINVIAVGPRDADRVWAAGVSWFRSDDGGRTCAGRWMAAARSHLSSRVSIRSARRRLGQKPTTSS